MAKSKGSGKHHLSMQPHKALIAYPALTTPCLVKAGDEASFMIILVTQESLYEMHTQVDGKAGSPLSELGVETLLSVHRQLVLTEWIDSTAAETKHVDTRGKSLKLTNPRFMVYGSYGSEREVLEKIDSQDLSGYYLGKLPKDMEEPVKIKDSNGKERLFGNLHNSILKLYKDNGYKHLFQINFKKVAGLTKQSAFELIWLYMDQEEYFKGGERDNLEAYFYEPDDVLLSKYITDELKKDNPYFEAIEVDKVSEEAKQPSYKLYSRQEETINIGGDAEDAKSVSFLMYKGILHARHPICVIEKDVPNIGVLSDVHISSRQTMLKLSRCQVIPGAAQEDSPYLGDVAHDYLESFKYLLEEVGENSDIISMPGDIYDSQGNCHPKKFVDEILKDPKNARTGRLWHYFDLEANAENVEIYPKYNDGLMMLALIHQHYGKKGKGVFFVSGNHEAYKRPYGISPRIYSIRANAGIPEEHNLTFFEATLIYGRSYREKGTAPSEIPVESESYYNFLPKCFEWLYVLFTPWHDFVVNYNNTFQLSGLGWGNEEEILWSKVLFGGELPRALGALNKGQKQLMEDAIKVKEENEKLMHVLMSHFTIVNFANNIPADGSFREKAIFSGASSPYFTRSHYEEGSFVQNRVVIYEAIQKKYIDYTISGHSHRAGFYKLADFSKIATSFDIAEPKSLKIGNVIVCGASGSFPTRNSLGEFFNGNVDLPNGLIIDFEEGMLEKVVHKAEHIRPRIAVSIDKYWVTKPGLYSTVHMKMIDPMVKQPPSGALVAAFKNGGKPDEELLEWYDMKFFQFMRTNSINDKELNFNLYINKEIHRYIGCPFKELVSQVKLHKVVLKDEKLVEGLVPLILKPLEEIPGNIQKFASINYSKFRGQDRFEIRDKPDQGDKIQIFYFISMHFNQVGYYKLFNFNPEIPLTFPVECEGRFAFITRKQGMHKDTPVYKEYKKFDEFKE